MDLQKKKRAGAIAQKHGPADGGCRLLSTYRSRRSSSSLLPPGRSGFRLSALTKTTARRRAAPINTRPSMSKNATSICRRTAAPMLTLTSSFKRQLGLRATRAESCPRKAGKQTRSSGPEPDKDPSPLDSRRAPTQNVRGPASITERRDICLLLTQDVGFFLKGSNRAGAP